MADDPFISIGENLGKIIFRKRNQRWADEEAEKDLKRKAFLQQIINDAAMERERERGKSDVERAKIQEEGDDRRAKAQLEQQRELEKARRDAMARKQAEDYLTDIYTSANRSREHRETLGTRTREADISFGNAASKALEAGLRPAPGRAEQAGWLPEEVDKPEESSGFSLFSPSTWGTPAKKKTTFNSITHRGTNTSAPPLPAPTAPPPPTAATDIPGLLDDAISKNMPGRSMGRESQLFNELLGALTNKVYRPANPR